MSGVAVENAGTRRLALVLWNGDVGGAEVVSLSLAGHMRRLGVEVTLVFIEQPMPLAARLGEAGVPYVSLGFARGREVLRHPRRYAAEIARVGPDGALLIECGFMGSALRAGGYGAPIAAVEHGSILEASNYRRLAGLPWHLARMSGAWADDVEIAVSDFVMSRMLAHPHADSVKRIYNGIEPARFSGVRTPTDQAQNGDCRVAFAGRLIHGKGADYLIEAVARLQATHSVSLSIAGEGPERTRLESLANRSGAGAAVRFLGLTHDMPAFWQAANVAVIPSAEFTEACPMTPLEAMAAGKPVIATRNGGLPEIVLGGETGQLVEPASADALAHALALYADSTELRRSHGAAGQARVSEDFHIAGCAQAYLDLFSALAEGKRA
jgi:glycosyltransferase involved in cell wall biosynthesis